MRTKKADILLVQQRMDWLAQQGFKPGQIKASATQSHTKALTAKFMRTVARINGDRSFMVGSVESYDAARGRSSDLWGVFDLIAVTSQQTIGVQACGRDWSEHIRKLRDDQYRWNCQRWLSNPGRTIELWGWAQYSRVLKDGRRGKQKVWVPRCQLITLDFLLDKEPAKFVDVWAQLEQSFSQKMA